MTIITLPLSKLDRDPSNVRKTYSSEGVHALAASIRADGFRLLQNIVVRKGDKRGRYFVTAGGRRLAALELLADAGEITRDFPVDCRVREAEDATAVSLAENLMREDMHPVDQYEAFNALASEKMSIPDIAARFGTTETIVRRRLALARVAPALLDLFRKEEMTFEQLSAFTVSDDHVRQVEVWEALPSWGRYAEAIKRTLAEHMVRATDKRVIFVGGLAAYEEAGGSVRRDLFDDRNDGFATDVGLLDKLVTEKLEAVVAEVRGEGWKWVGWAPSLPESLYGVRRHYPQTVPLSDEAKNALHAAQARYDEVADAIEHGGADDDAERRLAEIEDQINQLSAQKNVFAPEALATGGAFVSINHYGRVSVERGLISVADAEAGVGLDVPPARPAETVAPSLHSAVLTEDLTSQKTAALRVELAQNPDIALASTVHALCLDVLYPGATCASALQIHMTSENAAAHMKSPAANRALSAMKDLRDQIAADLPHDPADLWSWCLEQPRDMLLRALAFTVAQSVNVIEAKFDQRKTARVHGDQLGQALDVDLTKWFETTGDSYLSRIDRSGIEQAVTEAKGADAALKVRAAKTKSDAVQIAERELLGSGWLPGPLRIADVGSLSSDEPETTLGAAA